MLKKEDKIEEFDFGFSFTDEDIFETQSKVEQLQTAVSSDKNTIESLESRLNAVYNAITPFLDNLCKNPEKSTIHWPNRVQRIQEYKSKLKSIVEGKNI
jgi:hypothetical protein